MLKKLILTSSLLASSLLGLNAQEQQGNSSSIDGSTTKPNIIFIFADDWGWGDLSCHNHPYLETPNIDRLAAEGTDFQRFTVASGVCSPSRAAVITGQFPARLSINGHFAWVPNNAKRGMPDWLDLNAPLLPKMLQGAGYKTAHFGKWHLSNNMILDSPAPVKYGYDRAWAFNCSGEQLPVHQDVKESIDFIKHAHSEKKPFFLNLWIHEPHTPFHTVPKYEWKFRHLNNRAHQIYAATISHADDRIGELLNTLDELQLTDNTLVIFSSDNGPAGKEKNSVEEPKLYYDTATGAGWGIGAAKGTTGGKRGRKASLFEGGVGVPFIARWPKHIPVSKIDHSSLISAVDLLPTFCAIAGAKLPDGYKPDGLDITNVLKGEKAPSRKKALFWKYAAGPANPKSNNWVGYAVLKDQWKLAVSKDMKLIELYKINSDLSESNNLAQQYPEVVDRLKKLLIDWKAELPKEPTGNVFSEERKTLK